MNILAWVLSGLLGAVYLGAGVTKLATPRAKLLANPQMGWANDFSDRSIKLIATLEIIGALGVILPWLTGIAKVLTPIAAVGLAIVAAGAIVVHARRKEPQSIAVNTVLLILAVVVASLRFAQL